MMDVLLIVVIGGMGTVYGALVIGSVLFLVAQSYLQDLLRWAARRCSAVPVLSALVARPLAAVAGPPTGTTADWCAVTSSPDTAGAHRARHGRAGRAPVRVAGAWSALTPSAAA